MNKRLKAKWLKLLRSGEIPQARRSLRDGKGLCCIGVGYKALEGRVPPMSYSTNDASQAIGLTNNQESRLVTMNDSRGWGFPAIANWIEKNL